MGNKLRNLFQFVTQFTLVDDANREYWENFDQFWQFKYFDEINLNSVEIFSFLNTFEMKGISKKNRIIFPVIRLNQKYWVNMYWNQTQVNAEIPIVFIQIQLLYRGFGQVEEKNT